MTSIYAPPGSPPPHLRSQSYSHSSQPRQPAEEDDIPTSDPPPAYTPYPNANNSSTEQTLDVGPSRMDFSGPPPIPHHVEEEIRRQNTGISGSGYVGDGITLHSTGWSGSGFPPPPSHPSLPPRQPSSTFSPPPLPPPQAPPRHSPSTSSTRPNDGLMTPTETPTPGRPLLNKGKFLIYPLGWVCKKCNNTGYKHNDPYHPCKTCWSKYGKTYTSAIAHSWPTTTSTTTNGTTSSASNYQRPLRSFSPPQANSSWTGSSWTGTGFYGPPARPPVVPSQQRGIRWDDPLAGPRLNQSIMPPAGFGSQGRVPFVAPHYGYGPPPGSVVVMPGDPRIGGV